MDGREGERMELYIHFYTHTHTQSKEQLLKGLKGQQWCTSLLIWAGMLANSGLEANVDRFSTASMSGVVATRHRSRFSLEKSPSKALGVGYTSHHITLTLHYITYVSAVTCLHAIGLISPPENAM